MPVLEYFAPNGTKTITQHFKCLGHYVLNTYSDPIPNTTIPRLLAKLPPPQYWLYTNAITFENEKKTLTLSFPLHINR